LIIWSLLVEEVAVVPQVLEQEEEPEGLENHQELKEVHTLFHLKLVDLHYLFLYKVILFQLEVVEVIHLFQL